MIFLHVTNPLRSSRMCSFINIQLLSHHCPIHPSHIHALPSPLSLPTPGPQSWVNGVVSLWAGVPVEVWSRAGITTALHRWGPPQTQRRAAPV